MPITQPKDLRRILDRVVAETPVRDIHTHLYDPAFGDLLLWGVDELLTYHYLVAEFFRVSPMPYAEFWALSKPQQPCWTRSGLPPASSTSRPSFPAASSSGSPLRARSPTGRQCCSRTSRPPTWMPSRLPRSSIFSSPSSRSASRY